MLLFEGRKVGIDRCGAHVVEEGQVLGDVLVGPVLEEEVQEALVAAVEGALFLGEGEDRGEGLLRGRVHEDPGVEAIGPTDVWRCGKFFAFEEFVAVFNYLNGENGKFCMKSTIKGYLMILNEGCKQRSLPAFYQLFLFIILSFNYSVTN